MHIFCRQWATLIANLGGNLGFVGVSLITFFDVVYYLFDVFLILVWPRCYDVSEGVTKSVAPVKKIPKKIIILAGPPEQLPHGRKRGTATEKTFLNSIGCSYNFLHEFTMTYLRWWLKSYLFRM
jgi:hypothetical protein